RVVASESPWAGMSGAAVFCGPLLLGGVGWDTAGFDSHRVTVTPVSALAADPEFGRLGAHATGRGCVVEAAELHPWLARPARIGSVASLLRADAEVVPFTGREQILADLRAWCAGSRGFGVRVLVGAGGQGKTRLARELTARMRATGWVAGVVADAAP